MKLYGIWVAQNEADIIGETLNHIRKMGVYEKIFFYDLGSTDNTLEIAKDYTDILHEPQRLNEHYSGWLRVDLMRRNESYLKPGDWLAIIDSDELYHENPLDLIELAEKEEALGIEGEFIQFQFTDVDQEHLSDEDVSKSINERLLYYLINWSEKRFYKYLPGKGADGHIIDLNGKLCSKRLPIRHYPYRSPKQIQNKISGRLENRRIGGNPQLQFFSEHWYDYVIDHHLLYKFDGTFRHGVPSGVNWKQYYNFSNPEYGGGWTHAVYNNFYISWLQYHGYLPRWSLFNRGRKFIGTKTYKIRRAVSEFVKR